MSEPFLAEIRMVGFNFAPRGWALCDGQLLPINQNQALFSLLGTTYGGDGRTTFALPDLRGRVPMHKSAEIQLGQKGGEETHTLTANEMPTHLHAPIASQDKANSKTSSEGFFAQARRPIYGETPRDNTSLVRMNSGTVGMTGGNQAHNNMQPFTALNFVIALQGLFPSRS